MGSASRGGWHSLPNKAVEPTPTAFAPASLRLLVRLTASVRLPEADHQSTKQQPEVEGTRQQANHWQNMALEFIFWSTAHSGCTAYRGPT